MSAADDYPTIATMGALLPHNRAGQEAAQMLDELDALRAGRNLVDRIEALRNRARSAEELVTVLYRACREQGTPAQRASAVAAYHRHLGQERVA